MKLNIQSNLVCKPGIYAIKNAINNKIYIGSAVCLRSRFNGHRKDLRRGNHKNYILQNFYNKYKEDAGLEFVLLEVVNNKNDLLKIEQWYLNTLLPFDKNGFNILRIAGSSLGCKRRKESIEKWKKSMKGFVPPKGDDRKKIEFESKVNMSKNKVDWIPVAKYSLTGEFLDVYESVYMASVLANVNRTKVSLACDFKRFTCGGFIWRYAPSYICAYRISVHKTKYPLRCKAIIQKTLDGEIVNEFQLAKDAKIFGFSPDCIQQACSKKIHTHKGFKWEYKV